MAAQFEIRQKDLKAARQILGSAIGRAAKDKVRFQSSFTCLSRYFMFCVSLISHMKAGWYFSVLKNRRVQGPGCSCKLQSMFFTMGDSDIEDWSGSSSSASKTYYKLLMAFQLLFVLWWRAALFSAGVASCYLWDSCRYSRLTLRLNCNLGTSIGVELCMRSTWNGHQPTAMHGVSLRSWRNP